MTTDVIYPLLIAAGCLAIVIAVHLLTRPRPSRADIRIPDGGGPAGDGEPTRKELEQWHRDHEAAVLDYLDAHDPAPDRSGETSDIGDQLEAAVDAHPAPEMRAELAALRAAADALASARDREDDDAAGRHRELYLEYRSSWLERLRQFAVDETRLRATAARRLADESDTGGSDSPEPDSGEAAADEPGTDDDA